jgi:peptidoglycan/xylan/chitin deacetylase (PgdA/CDA1 family)
MQRAIHSIALTLNVTGLVSLCLFLRRHILRRYGVYVLSYHHVVPDMGTSHHDVTVQQLDAHLKFLKSWFRIVPLEQVPALLSGRIDRDYVALTFDDGYEDNFQHALPLLQRHDVPATVFLIAGLTGGNAIPWYDECRVYLPFLANTDIGGVEASAVPLLTALTSIMSGRGALEDRIERALEAMKDATSDACTAILGLMRRRYGQTGDHLVSRRFKIMRWDQVREMGRHGVTFGAHTMTHPILTKLPIAQIESEIQRSGAVIERQVGTPCKTFAYPNGDFDHRAVDVLSRHGFIVACTQQFGVNRPGANPLTLKRIGMGCTPDYVLAAKVSGLVTPVYALRQWWRAWILRSRSPLRRLSVSGAYLKKSA